MENDFDNMKLNIISDNVLYLIKNKNENISETSKLYLGWAKDYFKDVGKSIDSILDFDDEKGYYFVSNSKKIFLILNNNVKPRDYFDAEKIKYNADSIIGGLDFLLNSPGKFYESKISKNLFDYFLKMKLTLVSDLRVLN